MCPTRKKGPTSEPPTPLDRVLKSLADPVRLSIVRQLLAAGDEIACGGFEHDVTKATFSHHIAILEEAGLLQARADGTRRLMSLRLEFIRKHYPGLLELLRASG